MINQAPDIQRCTTRILLLTDRYAPSMGGVERQCSILAKEFVRRGCKTMIVTDRYLLSLPSSEQVDGMVIYRIWSLSFLRLFLKKSFASINKTNSLSSDTAVTGRLGNGFHKPLKYIRKFYRLMFYKIPLMVFGVSIIIALVRHRKEYDVIQVLQTHWLAYPAVLAGLILTKPVVAREASINALDALDDFPFKNHTKRTVLQHCHFVALSTAIFKNLIGRGVQSEKIAAIPNAVYLAPQGQRIIDDPFSVLFIGNVLNDPLQKGLDLLLQAWQRVSIKMPEARLTIVGDGDYTEFVTIATELGILHRVTFFGVSLTINELYCSHNIFVLPSRYEGMSNALLEAMSFGKACLVTTISGSDDVITHGVNGLKVEPENVSALADALLFLLEHDSEAKAFGNNAREYVRMHHSPEKISQQYLNLYTRVLQDSQVLSSSLRDHFDK
jgi:glycosyltransferase involved in cell wall biosynthesis